MDAERRRALLLVVSAIAGGGGGRGWTPDISAREDWDIVTTVETAQDPGCDDFQLIALEDGRLIVDADVPDGSLVPFADAVEQQLQPPYRVDAVRIEGALWGAGAGGVTVIRLPRIDGETCDVSRVGDTVSMTVDGVEVKAPPAAWEALRAFDGDVALTAEWLEDDTWIASVWPL